MRAGLVVVQPCVDVVCGGGEVWGSVEAEYTDGVGGFTGLPTRLWGDRMLGRGSGDEAARARNLEG
ncbi:hypothetical protein ACQB60_35145 [Actinomycetota bacterium Odt1-20B]